MLQPFPGYYIIRPQGSFVPLIPVDELPSWLQVGNWDWNDMSLFTAMVPVSFSSSPRIGEYDVICKNCNSNVDSLHRSVSEQSGNSFQHFSIPVAKPNKFPSGAFLSQSSQGHLSPLASSYLMSLKQPLFYAPGYPLSLTKPPYYENLQSPFIGMCLLGDWSHLKDSRRLKDCCQKLWAPLCKTQDENRAPHLPLITLPNPPTHPPPSPLSSSPPPYVASQGNNHGQGADGGANQNNSAAATDNHMSLEDRLRRILGVNQNNTNAAGTGNKRPRLLSIRREILGPSSSSKRGIQMSLDEQIEIIQGGLPEPSSSSGSLRPTLGQSWPLASGPGQPLRNFEVESGFIHQASPRSVSIDCRPTGETLFDVEPSEPLQRSRRKSDSISAQTCADRSSCVHWGPK
ncbi:hypothetical protein ETB97_002527 [Aspergillus alliaceus]|uniref:Uncharacterized protein n=1 Tax=Petromyces alliaceus TaxID=209559 RepID=A0A8H6A302_PETAA|nr:hypothetical protein ETB97_002527 [Aspergillus burnettii]